MFDSLTVLSTLLLYMMGLFILARWAERRSESGRSIADNSIVYSLSLAVYCTTWTFYGSVGKAAESGLIFLAIYLGPTLMMILWWLVLRRIVRLKNRYHITSLADFISTRYGKSHAIGMIVSLGALAGTIPYIALQFKSIIHTFEIITAGGTESITSQDVAVGPIVVILMILFTIVFGLRHIDPTERHQGMIVVVAAESLFKLIALMAVGFFVTYILFDGFGDILSQADTQQLFQHMRDNNADTSPFVTWSSFMILAMAAFLFLPRQFHVAVVENSNERHILTAMWLFPLYLILINLFVIPIAMGGLLIGHSAAEADFFVLQLPFEAGNSQLSLLAFLGGFSAGTGMIMITSMTMAVMISNYLLLPLINAIPSLAFLKRHLLASRWAIVTIFLILGYFFYLAVGESFGLVNIGIISFAAILQFAPAALCGIFWEKANRTGAFLGISAGFATWFYTLIIPAFIATGWLPSDWMSSGILGIQFLRPEQLFGLSALDPISHAVFWSLFFNIGWLVWGSLATQQSPLEEEIARDFTSKSLSIDSSLAIQTTSESRIPLKYKTDLITKVFSSYFTQSRSDFLVSTALLNLAINDQSHISISELAALNHESEKLLSGAIGSAAAHRALDEANIFTYEETQELSKVYSDLLARMRITPEELQQKVDYHRGREEMLTVHANELEERIIERDQEIDLRNEAESALRESEQRLESILEFSTAVVYLKDLEGRYLLINRSFEELFNMPRINILGKTDFDIFPKEVATKFRAHDLKVANKGAPMEFEEIQSQPDGNHTYISIKFPLYHPDGTTYAICGISTDITDRVKSREQLEQDNEIRLVISSILGIALEPITLIQKLEKDLNLVLSISCFNFQNRGCIFLRDTDKDTLNIAAHSGIDDAILSNFTEFDSATCFCGRAASGRATIMCDQSDDIKDSHGNEITAHGHYCVPIISTDKLLGIIRLYIDKGHKADANEEEFLQSVAHSIALTIEHQRAIDEVEHINQDLELRVEQRTQQLKIANLALADSLDTLTNTQARLIQTEKMAALGGLVAGVAHEINTPLGIGVTAASHLLQVTQDIDSSYQKGDISREEFDDYIATAKESTRMILGNLQRASDHIRSFKQIAVDQSTLDRRRFNLRTYIDETLLSLKPKLKQTLHQIDIDCPNNIELESYPGAFSQILTNLVVNSLIHAFEEKQSGLIKIGAVSHDKHVIIRYHDNGKGIPKDEIRQIFDPFFTTKRGQGGSGLGLNIVYNLITRQLGGVIECQSETGEGTTFIIDIPLNTETQDDHLFTE